MGKRSYQVLWAKVLSEAITGSVPQDQDSGEWNYRDYRRLVGKRFGGQTEVSSPGSLEPTQTSRNVFIALAHNMYSTLLPPSWSEY